MYFYKAFEVLTPSELSQIYKKSGQSGSIKAVSFMNILILILIAVFIFLGIKAYQKFRKYRKYKNDHDRFLDLCDEKNLTYHQIKILETLSRKYIIQPSLLLSSQKVFIKYALLEKKELLKNHKSSDAVYLDFETNMNAIRTALYRKKPGVGEILRSTRDIHAGTKVLMYRKKKKSLLPVKGLIYHVDNQQLLIKFDEDEKKLEVLLNSEKLYVFFNHEKDANYEFPVVILGKREIQKGDIKELHLAIDHANLKRRQRRKYIRTRVEFPLVVEKQLHEHESVPVSIQGKMLDLSEGGCCFLIKEPLKLHSVIAIKFFLNDKAIEHVLAKVVHVNQSSKGYIIHIDFLEIGSEQKEAVHFFISSHIHRRV